MTAKTEETVPQFIAEALVFPRIRSISGRDICKSMAAFAGTPLARELGFGWERGGALFTNPKYSFFFKTESYLINFRWNAHLNEGRCSPEEYMILHPKYITSRSDVEIECTPKTDHVYFYLHAYTRPESGVDYWAGGIGAWKEHQTAVQQLLAKANESLVDAINPSGIPCGGCGLEDCVVLQRLKG